MRALFAVVVGVAIWFVPGAASACGCCDHHGGHAAAHPSSAAPAQLGPGEARVRISVTGMHCDHCVSRVESALHGIAGVKWAGASLQGGEAVVIFEKAKVGTPKLVEAIDALGFKAGTRGSRPLIVRSPAGTTSSRLARAGVHEWTRPSGSPEQIEPQRDERAAGDSVDPAPAA